jgi:hypothetical protein
MRLPRVQFTLRSLMIAVAAMALMLSLTVGAHQAWLILMVWLFPLNASSASPTVLTRSISVSVNFAGYEIPHTSPMFWVITAILLAAVLGILVA